MATVIAQKKRKRYKGVYLSPEAINLLNELRQMLQDRYNRDEFGAVTQSAVVEACIRYCYSQRGARLKQIAEA